MARSMFDALLKEPERMGARTQSRNTLGINHPLAESSPIARIPISMMPGGGPVSGYTQEDLATLQLPEETTLFSPLGYDITDKDLAKFGLATDAMDWLPGAALVGGAATGAGLLGRALKGKNYAPTSTDDIGAALLGQRLQDTGALDDAMVAYQGSPHKFDALDPTKIGTGEGAQMFGHGMYVAENPKVAGLYKDKLATGASVFLDGREVTSLFDEFGPVGLSLDIGRLRKAIGLSDSDVRNAALAYFDEFIKGSKQDREIVEQFDFERLSSEPGSFLYEIDVPDEDIAKMLDWDAPLSKQPESVKRVILDSPAAKQFEKQMNDAREAFGVDAAPDWMDDYTGQSFYKQLVELEGDKIAGVLQPGTTRHTAVRPAQVASKHLEELGIPGIKYYDQGSRGGIKKHQWGKIAKTLLKKDTRNMVLFDELAKRARVLKRNDETIAQPSVDEFIGKLLED